MKKIVVYILLSSSLWACRVDYTLDTKQAKRRLVVDGLITTLKDSSRIILSYTSDDYRTGSKEFVNNATVTVSEEGNVVSFTPTLKKGKYIAAGYVGKVGKKYHLKIVVDGAAYEADDTLFQVTPIKELDFIKNPGSDPKFEKYQYQVRYHVDKQKGKNYYKTIQYRNGASLYDAAFVYADVVLKDKDNIIPTHSRYMPNDWARIDLLSISEQAYKFYADLNNIQNNDGGIFSAVAANPVSNISNGAMGFFQASDNCHREIEIKP